MKNQISRLRRHEQFLVEDCNLKKILSLLGSNAGHDSGKVDRRRISEEMEEAYREGI